MEMANQCAERVLNFLQHRFQHRIDEFVLVEENHRRRSVLVAAAHHL